VCTSIVTRIAMNLGCPEMASLAYIEGEVPIHDLDYFFTHASYARNSIILYLCCMVARRSS
jgi:anaerobic ribonucleoside-triphosphate reductase